MNSAFSEQILAYKLSDINYTRSCIQSLSSWCISHQKNAEQVVQTWAKEFCSSGEEKKIPFLYLANDILQNGRHRGPEFVDEFWKVLPGALMDVLKNGGEHGKNVISRLVNIWIERKVFGSRSQDLKASILGKEPPPALELNKNHSCSSAGIKSSVGGKEEKILSAFRTVISEKPKEDVHMNRCMIAVQRVRELERDIKYAFRQEDPWKETVAEELHNQEITLTKCIEKLISVEANRATLVSQLKGALGEQESALENVRTRIQLAQGMLEEAPNMQRQLNVEPVVMSVMPPPSAPHPFQTVPVQQAPIQNQTLAFQPQYNLYQSSTMQYLQPSEGVMNGLLDSYNALPSPTPPPPPPSSPPPPTPPPPATPPPPPPHMMNLMTMPVSWTQQLPVASVQQLSLPTPPPPMPMYQPLPINQVPISQPVSINQQPSQFSIQKPMAPSYRPLLPPPMAFYH